jgi:glutamate racemase
MTNGPIGVFDSGYGGLTILKDIVKVLPQYDYIYLGDNARTPYGTRSFETVYKYTLECVEKLFAMGCPLVVLACNTASAKALRTIQQKDLEKINPTNRVLGVIRPTAEIIGEYTTTNHIGILATKGTVLSQSYPIEIEKFFPNAIVHQQACAMWVPLIENNEHLNEGADFFIKKSIDALLQQHIDIDTVLLACTHYPLLINSIKKYLPNHIKLLSQGNIVATSLEDYLHRHPILENRITKNETIQFFTTDEVDDFNNKSAVFFGKEVQAKKII